MEKTVKKVTDPIILKNIQIPYNTDTWQPRNFRGLEHLPYNREGERNFCIFLDPEQVDCEKLIEDGWNIKKTENKRDPQAEPSYMLRVKVKYHPEESDLARLNPKIRICTQEGEMMMDEDNVGDLDSAQIMKATVVINGRWSDSATYTGWTAYLKKLVVRVYEETDNLDDLAKELMDD